MLSVRMKANDRVPSAKAIGVSYVSGYRLTFDKASVDGSGKCDAERTGENDDRVYGVLYSVDKAEKHKLDVAEGLGNGYEEKDVTVPTKGGQVKALAYLATKKEASLKPYHWYKAFVVAGAVEHGLPFAYIEWLRTFESQQDKDDERRLRNERILASPQVVEQRKTYPKSSRRKARKRKQRADS